MSLKNQFLKASAFSILSEIVAKIIGPLGFLLLTRILSPEDFGVVAVATTVLGIGYVISDMGISQVIIQQRGDKDYLLKLNNAGFWFNLTMGIILFVLMVFFSEKLANLLGEPSSKSVISVLALQVIFYSLSSVQNAIKKRDLDFKFLFYLRLITVAAPLLVSIPLAFAGGGYWAIVYGQIFGSLTRTIALWKTSKWKPSLYFDLSILRCILTKSIWNTIDQIFIWIPLAFDTYLISNYLSAKELGLYSTSRTLFSTAITLSLGAIMPVLFSTFSKIQTDDSLFLKSILIFQKIVFSIAIFMCVGVFIFSGLIEIIIFTNQWAGISNVFGIIFLMMGFEYFYSVIVESLNAKGYFQITAINTVLTTLISVPFLFFSIHYGLIFYVTIRMSLIYLRFPIIFYYSKKINKISFTDCLINNKKVIYIIMGLLLLNLLISQFDFTIIINNGLKLLVFCLAGVSFLMLEKETLLLLIKQFKFDKII